VTEYTSYGVKYLSGGVSCYSGRVAIDDDEKKRDKQIMLSLGVDRLTLLI